MYDRGTENNIVVRDTNSLKLVAGKQSSDTKISIVADGAKVTLVNNGEISGIRVKSESSVTLRGNATEAPNLNVTGDASIRVQENTVIGVVTINSADAKVSLNIAGSVEKVVLKQKADITISGSTESVAVQNDAAGSTISSAVKTDLQLNADASVSLEKGAEGSNVTSGSADVAVNVNNNTDAAVTVTDSSGQESTIASGSTSNAATPSGSTSAGENSGSNAGGFSGSSSNAGGSGSSSSNAGNSGTGSSGATASDSTSAESAPEDDDTVKFYVGNTVYESKQVDGTQTLNSVAPEAPKKDGCEFVGWSTDGTGENVVDGSQPVSGTAYYAAYKITYEVNSTDGIWFGQGDLLGTDASFQKATGYQWYSETEQTRIVLSNGNNQVLTDIVIDGKNVDKTSEIWSKAVSNKEIILDRKTSHTVSVAKQEISMSITAKNGGSQVNNPYEISTSTTGVRLGDLFTLSWTPAGEYTGYTIKVSVSEYRVSTQKSTQESSGAGSDSSEPGKQEYTEEVENAYGVATEDTVLEAGNTYDVKYKITINDITTGEPVITITVNKSGDGS